MSDSDMARNPFAALFPSLVDVQAFVQNSAEVSPRDFPLAVTEKDLATRRMESSENSAPEIITTASHVNSNVVPDDQQLLSVTLEDIFRVVVSGDISSTPTKGPCCVFLETFRDSNKCLTLDILDEVVFERLVLDDPQHHVVRKSTITSETAEVTEPRVFFYLYQCYFRLQKAASKLKNEDFRTIEKTIVSQASTCLCHCDIYPGKKIQEQVFYLLEEYHDSSGHQEHLEHFLRKCANSIKHRFDAEEEQVSLLEVLSHSFDILRARFARVSIVSRDLFVLLDILKYFTLSPSTATALLDFSTPSDVGDLRSFQESLLGSPLSISCLPRREADPFEFFETPSQSTMQEHSITESNLWLPLKGLATEMHNIFYTLLRLSHETRDKTLTWLGQCIESCADRGKLWNSQVSELFLTMQRGDGFALNLGAVLLRLARPFSEPYSPKLLKVDYRYCSVEPQSEEQAASLGLHLRGLSKETCLVPREEGESATMPNTSFNFPTECFFACHRVLSLGFRVVHERLARLSQDLNRVRRVYEETRAQGGESSEVGRRLQENMEKGMTRFLSLKAVLLEPTSLEQMLRFHVASATWLCHVATDPDLDSYQPLTLPFPEHGNSRLALVPEFVVENICDCIVFVKRFNERSLEFVGHDLEHLMTLVLVFMGSPQRMNNPHLRARLAEMLEVLMTSSEEDSFTGIVPLSSRKRLFLQHPFAMELSPTLLHVFVSIEMTGQSVTFEQKFHYRRPMYTILENLWNIPGHRNKMKSLAAEAEANIECSTPPLFLRFINLLINDAIFLLDEALSYMSRLRELQQPGQAAEANLQHLGMLAHFHNVMGTETIRTLARLTAEVSSIFCHPTMVDRIATMLNYFLLHLVGPQKKNLKVKDFSEYEFKPQELVQNICKIYTNLGSEDSETAQAFCIAVSRDGRSYSPDLFPQAQKVLMKIRQGELFVAVGELAKKIQKAASQQKQEDEATGDAPEEFLDPIMSTIMADPVVLPSSGITIDRSTIARHLLSDQTDPFNRSPLTMEMVVPNEGLKKKILEWRAKRMQ
uniref:Ubiquitin conjugation factor E4 A n=1 Tax=Rhipicephalus zambeziensis TaxID=60191 RepID=A0A224ZB65_9ACAR